jgi:hypothetical protein
MNVTLSGSFRLLFVTLCALALTAAASCGGEKKAASKPVEDFLKQSGARDVAVDAFVTSPDIPNKAYLGVTVVYSFATSEGTPQKEFLGYVVRKDGADWRIEKNVTYTTDAQHARQILASKEK